ncbi:cysteine--tRNA ligase, partial [Patescibacteria group bacterium]|nr:cysteine--tRNA ligase [Patescibacteria group bacterium]MBU1868172.1 cysteine--tRNA ligase [Patescibacteria group bacterium]
MKLHDSLLRRKREFKPINPPRVGIYTCGPTVYDYVTIGNWRTYTLGDLVVRVLKYSGYEVDYVMNVTDVGHLTGDNLGDASTGKDRIEEGASREGKTAWEIADHYTRDFLGGYKELNLTAPRLFCKATDHIQEQIELIQSIERKGYTYLISDGVYFDVRAYEKAGNKYGELSTLDQIKEGARVQPNPEKRDPRDFALWKFSSSGSRRFMEWESPWSPPGSTAGVMGFPGWHIECSAMSMKYLGQQLDIHIGGEDLQSTHHPNEIAQSEAATGVKPFVKYWLHGAFLRVDGRRMGKSQGNAYTLHDVEGRGFVPLALRYFYLTAHYRSPLNFTWDALQAAQTALFNLKREMYYWDKPSDPIPEYDERLLESLNDDLSMPKAIAVVWDLVKSDYPSSTKHATLLKWENVLGLGLDKPFVPVEEEVALKNLPPEV